MANNNCKKFVFFGTPDISVDVLDQLKSFDIIPSLIITQPDKAQGRGLEITPPPVKVWAMKNQIPYLQPQKLKEIEEDLEKVSADWYLVVAYGKILPNWLLSIPGRRVLNIHPSLLPLYRGPSPIESTLLHGQAITGVSLMILDEEMDHGPLLGQADFEVSDSTTKKELYEKLSSLGAVLVRDYVPEYLKGSLTAIAQHHDHATYCEKFSKADGEIDEQDTSKATWNKWRAFYGWPGLYFYRDIDGKKIRYKITDATLEDDKFVIKKVIPEGKKEMEYKK
jgi:methionyl-tRNA formyltransferase